MNKKKRVKDSKLAARKNQRGLSAVITSMILILLVLTSIGIIWVVIKTFIEQNKEEIQYKSQCIGIDLQITNIECSNSGEGSNYKCNITLSRGTGGGDFNGLRIIFSNSDSTVTSKVDKDIPIDQLTPRTIDNIDTKLTEIDETKTIVVPYFVTLKNKKIFCSG